MTPEQKIQQIRARYSGKLKIAQQKAAKELAIIVISVLRVRVRIEEEGTNGKLKPLSPKYIEQRKKSKNLHPDTTPSTSNLTATGQMLDALRGRAGGGKVTIDIKPTKRKKGLYGKAPKDLTNEDVRKYVEDAGREFLKLSEVEKREVIDLTTQMILDELKGLFK